MCQEPVQHIPDTDHVVRHCPVMHTDKREGRRFPPPACFVLRPDEKGLSVNWMERMGIERHFILLGLQHNRRSQYLNPAEFILFKLPVGALRSMDGVQEVVHVPVYNGDPAPMGSPNNPWHAEIIIADTENYLDVRDWLSQYCLGNLDTTAMRFPGGELEGVIDGLRERNNDTDYHRNWENVERRT